MVYQSIDLSIHLSISTSISLCAFLLPMTHGGSVAFFCKIRGGFMFKPITWVIWFCILHGFRLQHYRWGRQHVATSGIFNSFRKLGAVKLLPCQETLQYKIWFDTNCKTTLQWYKGDVSDSKNCKYIVITWNAKSNSNYRPSNEGSIKCHPLFNETYDENMKKPNQAQTSSFLAFNLFELAWKDYT